MYANRLSHNTVKGIEEAKHGNTSLGCVYLKAALKETDLPEVKAWYGYCLAREGKNYTQAHRLCLAAVKQNPDDSDLYLALGRLYLVGERRRSAIIALERGFKKDQNADINRLLQSIGSRKNPVFPFLRRENPVNVTSGRLLSRWGLR